MFRLKILVCFVIITLFGSCSKEPIKKSIINEKSLELTIKKIIENYQDIQKRILKEKIFIQKSFFSNIKKIFKP